ncbi:hypothetical protein MMC21_007010 [Puttea exsequens]|nr:hypothetical protein [Puttea exsequens]
MPIRLTIPSLPVTIILKSHTHSSATNSVISLTSTANYPIVAKPVQQFLPPMISLLPVRCETQRSKSHYKQSITSFFKTLVDHDVTVELKNDISIKGTLKSVDQFLNIKLDNIEVVDELKYPHLVSWGTWFSERDAYGLSRKLGDI